MAMKFIEKKSNWNMFKVWPFTLDKIFKFLFKNAEK